MLNAEKSIEVKTNSKFGDELVESCSFESCDSLLHQQSSATIINTRSGHVALPLLCTEYKKAFGLWYVKDISVIIKMKMKEKSTLCYRGAMGKFKNSK